MNQFKDLLVWQKSRILVKEVYLLCAHFPKNEQFGLVDQIKRSSISIPSNIAEWNSRWWQKEQIHFLYIARGSCAELETQVILATDIWFVDETISKPILESIEEISKMLVWLIKSKQ